MTTQTERLAALEQRILDHEARCEERLTEIRAAAASTLAAVEGLKGRCWAIAVALLAWALAQVWSASQMQVRAGRPPIAAEGTAAAAGPVRL